MSMFGMTDEKKTMLIQEIYQRPLIWKVTHEKYNDVPLRWIAFEEIARALSDDDITFTSDMIKLSWKNMMDYYNQIRRRHDRAIAAGLDPPDSKWQFYSMMHFTKQDKPPVKRKYNWMEPSKIVASNEQSLDDRYLPPMDGEQHGYGNQFLSGSVQANRTPGNFKRSRLQAGSVHRSKQFDSAGRMKGARNSGGVGSNDEDDPDYVDHIGSARSSQLQQNDRAQSLKDKNSGDAVVVRKSERLLGKYSQKRSDSAEIDKPIAGTDSASSFARGIASRLCVIKERSTEEYYKTCQDIDNLIKKSEQFLSGN